MPIHVIKSVVNTEFVISVTPRCTVSGGRLVCSCVVLIRVFTEDTSNIGELADISWHDRFTRDSLVIEEHDGGAQWHTVHAIKCLFCLLR